MVLQTKGLRVPSQWLEDNEEIIMGVDEAGRGPVLGPMVYGGAYWPKALNETLSAEGYDDSKVLDSSKRESLFQRIQQDERVGWVVREIEAEEISEKMLSTVENLNEMSRSATLEMIDAIRNTSLNLTTVYVDTVGDPEWYESWLTKKYNGSLKFVVAKKADSLYKVVSAASICAKVTRDCRMENWKWSEPNLRHLSTDFGSGYPSDPKTKEWLQKSLDPVFLYPRIARFSWGTVDVMAEKALAVKWANEESSTTTGITKFFGKKKDKNQPTRSSFYHKRSINLALNF